MFPHIFVLRPDEAKAQKKGAEGEGGTVVLKADSVIVSAGSSALEKERDAFSGVAMDVIPVGDCVHASNIRNAVDTAWCAANTL